MTVTVATAAAMLVVTKILPMDVRLASPSALTVEQPLKPNQQNQRINTPSAPSVMLWPRIALGFPFLSYFPIRGPRIFAPIRAEIPPTI